MIGNRNFKKLVYALFQSRNYTALYYMFKVYRNFFKNLYCYVTAKGDYPRNIELFTPVGLKSIQLFSHHDLLTVNEIFCRQDYKANKSIKFILDLGSNIGISGLYFLTRNEI